MAKHDREWMIKIVERCGEEFRDAIWAGKAGWARAAMANLATAIADMVDARIEEVQGNHGAPDIKNEPVQFRFSLGDWVKVVGPGMIGRVVQRIDMVQSSLWEGELQYGIDIVPDEREFQRISTMLYVAESSLEPTVSYEARRSSRTSEDDHGAE